MCAASGIALFLVSAHSCLRPGKKSGWSADGGGGTSAVKLETTILESAKLILNFPEFSRISAQMGCEARASSRNCTKVVAASSDPPGAFAGASAGRCAAGEGLVRCCRDGWSGGGCIGGWSQGACFCQSEGRRVMGRECHVYSVLLCMQQ